MNSSTTMPDQAIPPEMVAQWRASPVFREHVTLADPGFAKELRSLADTAFTLECKLANRYMDEPESREEIRLQNPAAADEGERRLASEERKRQLYLELDRREAVVQNGPGASANASNDAPVDVEPIKFPATVAGKAAGHKYRQEWSDALVACHTATPAEKLLGLTLASRSNMLTARVYVAADKISAAIHRSKGDVLAWRKSLIEQGWLAEVGKHGRTPDLQLRIPGNCPQKVNKKAPPPRKGQPPRQAQPACKPCGLRNEATKGRDLRPVMPPEGARRPAGKRSGATRPSGKSGATRP